MKRKAFSFILTSCIIVGLSGFLNIGNRKLLSYTEVVLKPGMKVTATNATGTVTIEAGEGTKRIFRGNGWKKERNLIPRTTRWYGSLGLYDPSPSLYPFFGQLLVDEGRLYFSSISEALKYLYEDRPYFKPIYTNNGLVFGYGEHIVGVGKPIRNVQLWQIYINGKRPTSIPGADDSAFLVSGGTIQETSMPYPAPVGYEKKLGKEEYQPKKKVMS